MSSKKTIKNINIDYPYEVPKYWEWQYLTDCVSVRTGKKDANYGTQDGKYLFFTCASQPILCPNYSFEGKSILVMGNGANVGQSIYYEGQFEAYQRTYVLQSETVNLKFIFYHMQGFWKNFNSDKQYGSATNYIRLSNFETYQISLPPLKEQEKIVQKIEELFSHLDKGIEELKTAQAKLKVYSYTILKNAFEIKGDSVQLKDICEIVRGGSPRPAGSEIFYNGNIPFLKVADLTHCSSPYLSTYTYTIKEAGLSKTRLVPQNTLLLSNSGATLGVPRICTFETTFNDGIAGFLGMENECLLYHYYYWESKTLELRSINQGAGQPNLNTTIIGNQVIPKLSYKEQEKIALEIEARLSICDSVEETIKENLIKAENLKQAILQKAFKGELV